MSLTFNGRTLQKSSAPAFQTPGRRRFIRRTNIRLPFSGLFSLPFFRPGRGGETPDITAWGVKNRGAQNIVGFPRFPPGFPPKRAKRTLVFYQIQTKCVQNRQQTGNRIWIFHRTEKNRLRDFSMPLRGAICSLRGPDMSPAATFKKRGCFRKAEKRRKLRYCRSDRRQKKSQYCTGRDSAFQQRKMGALLSNPAEHFPKYYTKGNVSSLNLLTLKK